MVGRVKNLRHLGLFRWLLWCSAWVVFETALRPVFRIRSIGTERLPVDGPYFLLSNHVSSLDTFWMSVRLGRPAYFMASAALFGNPVVAFALRSLGAFPKEKFAKDKGSMQQVQALYDAGQIIQIMPEGLRT